jgi:hypothetical protein
MPANDPRARALGAWAVHQDSQRASLTANADRDRLRAMRVIRKLYDDPDLELPGLDGPIGGDPSRYAVTVGGADLEVYLPSSESPHDLHERFDAQAAVYVAAVDGVSIPFSERRVESLAQLGRLYAIANDQRRAGAARLAAEAADATVAS